MWVRAKGLSSSLKPGGSYLQPCCWDSCSWLTTCFGNLPQHTWVTRSRVRGRVWIQLSYHPKLFSRSCAPATKSPAQAGCMRQVLGPGALGRPRGMQWGGRWEGESGWGIHVNPWLIYVNVWQKPLQYCKVISFQLIKKKRKRKKKKLGK